MREGVKAVAGRDIQWQVPDDLSHEVDSHFDLDTKMVTIIRPGDKAHVGGMNGTVTNPPQEGDIVTNEAGAKQAHIAAAFTSMPATATRLVAECLGRGDRVYGKANHERIPTEDHVNHAIAHLYAWVEDTRSGLQYPHTRELHLVHAVTRALLALDCAVNDGHPTQYRHPSGD